MVESKASFSKIDKAKLASFIEQVPIWEFEGISRIANQQLSKEQKKEISIRYYDAMKALLKSKLWFFVSIFENFCAQNLL